MLTKARLQDISKVEFAVTITASVEDWKGMLKALNALNNGCATFIYPLGGFVNQVEEVLYSLEKTHIAYGSPKETP